MYKLVAVGGKIRGSEFNLTEGDNFIGRSSDCDIYLEVNGISKKHCKINVNNDVIYIEDLKSSNGTIVNDKIITKTPLSKGDLVALPDVIFQVVHMHEKRVIIKKAIQKSEDVNIDDFERAPSGGSPIDTLKYVFRTKIMKFFYKMNMEYDWAAIVAIFLTALITINIAIAIMPIMHDHKRVLKREVAQRAADYADEIARNNALAISQKDLDRIDTNFLNQREGVDSYELIDPEGRILRPESKMNEYTSDGFSIDARDWAVSKNKRSAFVKDITGGKIGIARRIQAYNPTTGHNEIVGVIAIHFAPRSWLSITMANSTDYLRALFISFVLGFFFYMIMIYMTQRYVSEVVVQMEEAQRGKRSELKPTFLFELMRPLEKSVNSLIQKLIQLEGSESEFDMGEMEDDSTYVKIYSDVLESSAGPSLVLDSEKRLKRMNYQAEDLLGIRETSSEGEDLLGILREKGIAATIIDLCDQSANEIGDCQKGDYEIQGFDYSICVSSMLGKDNFAKAFYVSFLKEE